MKARACASICSRFFLDVETVGDRGAPYKLANSETVSIWAMSISTSRHGPSCTAPNGVEEAKSEAKGVPARVQYHRRLRGQLQYPRRPPLALSLSPLMLDEGRQWAHSHPAKNL